MSKQLEKLFNKASQLTEGTVKVNGRQWDMYSRDYEELREKYAVEVTNEDGARVMTFRHWGTETAILKAGKLVDVYGESKSDADSVQQFLNTFASGDYETHFYPVNGGFVCEEA